MLLLRADGLTHQLEPFRNDPTIWREIRESLFQDFHVFQFDVMDQHDVFQLVVLGGIEPPFDTL